MTTVIEVLEARPGERGAARARATAQRLADTLARLVADDVADGVSDEALVAAYRLARARQVELA